MKKVRFETPDKGFKCIKMSERECHSPRPLIESRMHAIEPEVYSSSKILPYSNDPIQLFECSNSSPYPTMNKTTVQTKENVLNWSPSSDLELSMLDSTCHEPCRPVFSRAVLGTSNLINSDTGFKITPHTPNSQAVPSIQNNAPKPPNVLVRDNDFFIRRDNLNKFHFDTNPIDKQLTRLSLDKENDPFLKKSEIVTKSKMITPINRNVNHILAQPPSNRDCNCHHCFKNVVTPDLNSVSLEEPAPQCHGRHCTPQNNVIYNCQCRHPPPPPLPIPCNCCNHLPQPVSNNCQKLIDMTPKLNAVDKKTWAIEKYEQSKKSDTMEVDKQANISKEKREPTVSDLFKIIKLQNEQLQLLQEKVDKFISASQKKQSVPQNCLPEHVAIESVTNDHHKISIGVMTSFEVVRTSTIINQEVVKTSENAQIQCNRSQISIKEVMSKAQSPNLNFLDGIAPVSKNNQMSTQRNFNVPVTRDQNAGANEEKTLNELSLYNVQVDNATTPLMSPEQSLYLDVRDYSDSEDDNQSNVGWTYYNKVMTHVNGMLQDSDMPSSASALYRNTRQQMQTVQMQIDKTNVSVTKRVKFGDDPLGIHQPHIYAGSSDTSLKMNQLAAKYLNMASVAAPQHPARPTNALNDMSFATRNYMEQHRLLKDTSSRPPSEIPKFLDITALKQQPKFL